MSVVSGFVRAEKLAPARAAVPIHLGPRLPEAAAEVSFDEGDLVVLIDYVDDNFKGIQHGEIGPSGDLAEIDAIVDLQNFLAISSEAAEPLADPGANGRRCPALGTGAR